MRDHKFTAGFLFCGLGAGARGFLQASAQLGKERGKFVNLGGVDNDPAACADFEYLTGAPAVVADLSTMTPAELRAAWGDESPDAVFSSPPCKGLSGLLSSKMAATPKYQALNELVWKGIFLTCETWDTPPGLIVLENVPRIQSRGKDLLMKAKGLLRQYGYLIDEATHDCGEIGGLAQHRRRYLLVARQPKRVPAYVYRPPLRPVKPCGAVLETLPLPEDPAAGELHKLPKLSWLNWVRLALIPAGGDWRDLPRAIEPAAAPVDQEARKAWEQKGEKTNGQRHWFKGKYGVGAWDEPARAVIGGPSNGASAVADPRLAEALQLGQTANGADAFKGRPGLMGVTSWDAPAPTVIGRASVSGGHASAAVADPRAGRMGVTAWDQPAKTVCGESYPSNGANAVADPRMPPELLTPLKPGQAKREQWARYDVRGWDQPARTVAGTGTNGGMAVADPRVGLNHEPNRGALGVQEWSEPAKCVRGRADVRTGPAAVADPRVGFDEGKEPYGHVLRVRGWDEPAGTVTASPSPSSGAQCVADPRAIGLGADNPRRHWNKYRVTDWGEPAGTVTGTDTRVGSGAPSVADPRVAVNGRKNRFTNQYKVRSWDEPAGAVTGDTDVQEGAPIVGDPRIDPSKIPLGCRPRGNTKGPYGVMSWEEAAGTITGTARVDNGTFAIADPRKPPPFLPVIIAKDRTWHRPLTTLELAALQGLPATVDGKPLKLAGKKVAAWRERIGNAVPVGAGAAIAESLLTALLAAKLGTWTLGSTGIWVRNEDGVTEVEALIESAAA